MTRRVQLAFSQKLSSDSNNASREKAPTEKAKLCMENGVFNCDMLKIDLSDHNEIWSEHTVGVKES